jgi:hypothetical protein
MSSAMHTFNFTLRYFLPEEHPVDQLLQQLFDAGCNDALVGLGTPGVLSLQFDRLAADVSQATHSAMAAIASAVPGAKLLSVTRG